MPPPHIVVEGVWVFGAITYPPDDGILDGHDVINVRADIEWTDGYTETCIAVVKAWTTTAVHVWADTSRGQYVTWLPADKVTRRGRPATG